MVKVSNDEFMFVRYMSFNNAVFLIGSLLSDQIYIYGNIVCIQERYNILVASL